MFRDVEYLTDAPPDPSTPPEARQRVTALYEAHALGLVKLAKIMLGDQATAEDIVQDAFLGLYRKWPSLADQGRALGYLRTSVLNGCRTALRARARRDRRDRAAAARDGWLAADSAEAAVLLSEEHHEVLAAVSKLAARQRQALTLRYYLGLSPEETARAMGISVGTVKSAVSRAIAALGDRKSVV